MAKLASALIRVAAIVIITLLALEAILQLAFPQLPHVLIERMPQFRERTGFRLHTEHGLIEYPPGQQVDLEITKHSGDLFRLTCLPHADAQHIDSYQVKYVRDSHGFRNPEPWPADLDLLVVGDSFVAAESIAEPFWQGISDAMLVLGLPGSGTLEQQRLMETYGLPRNPETVVLAYFAGNDLADSQAYISRQRSNTSLVELAHQGKNTLDYSVVFNLALYVRDSLLPSSEVDCHYPQTAATNPPIPVAFYDKFLPMLALDRETLLASKMFQLTRDSIGEMAEALNETGAHFIVMYIPQKAELYWKYLSDDDRQEIVDANRQEDETFTVGQINANIDAQRNLLSDATNELGIYFLDLTLALNAAIDEGASPYFFADTHWNQLGHNIARNALLDFLNRTTLEN